MDELINFGERLTEIMLDKNINIKELSKRIGVNITTVYRWKQGTIKIFLSKLIKLVEYLKCSIEFIIGRSEKIIDFIPQSCPPFYDRLRTIMREKQISRYRIAKDTKIDDNYFTTWKKGADPHILSLIILADYLDITLDYLVGRDN